MLVCSVKLFSVFFGKNSFYLLFFFASKNWIDCLDAIRIFCFDFHCEFTQKSSITNKGTQLDHFSRTLKYASGLTSKWQIEALNFLFFLHFLESCKENNSKKILFTVVYTNAHSTVLFVKYFVSSFSRKLLKTRILSWGLRSKNWGQTDIYHIPLKKSSFLIIKKTNGC